MVKVPPPPEKPVVEPDDGIIRPSFPKPPPPDVYELAYPKLQELEQIEFDLKAMALWFVVVLGIGAYEIYLTVSWRAVRQCFAVWLFHENVDTPGVYQPEYSLQKRWLIFGGTLALMAVAIHFGLRLLEFCHVYALPKTVQAQSKGEVFALPRLLIAAVFSTLAPLLVVFLAVVREMEGASTYYEDAEVSSPEDPETKEVWS